MRSDFRTQYAKLADLHICDVHLLIIAFLSRSLLAQSGYRCNWYMGSRVSTDTGRSGCRYVETTMEFHGSDHFSAYQSDIHRKRAT